METAPRGHLPLELKLFGTTDLRSDDATAAHRVMAQPKRVALLAYLVIASRIGLARRDGLLALFWPDDDAAHGRGALNQALSFLRKHVGASVIVTRGDEEVGVDPSMLRCDVLEFDAALASRAFERASALYQGPLMDAFHVTGCDGFMRWLENERARLDALALSAVTMLADQADATGHPEVCVQWMERALQLAPFDEASALQLADAQRRCGDRVGALRVLTQFAARLHAELNIVPSKRLTRVIVALQDDPGISSDWIRPPRLSPTAVPLVVRTPAPPVIWTPPRPHGTTADSHAHEHPAAMAAGRRGGQRRVTGGMSLGIGAVLLAIATALYLVVGRPF